MYRILKPSADAYITDRVIRKVRRTGANTGAAGSLDLFVIHGMTFSGSTPNHELSRLLMKFDMSDLAADYSAGKIDITNPTFNCTLRLFDVYGGQPTPSNFTLKVYPLSRSFDEGIGRDVVFYQDSDVANFLTASYAAGTASIWFLSGANMPGLLGSPDIDIISSGNLGAGVVNLFTTQSFVLGTENLVADVTSLVSATLVGLLPDKGFRVSFQEADENDTKTRFVKRFGSMQAIDPTVQPQLVVKFDDSINSHESNFLFDTTGTLVVYNYVRGLLSNFVSGAAASPVTGSNCAILRLSTPVSTSNGFVDFTTYVTASQHKIGTNFVKGVYSASFAISSSDTNLRNRIQQSGSIVFTQVWTTLDGSVPLFSGSLSVQPLLGTSGPSAPKRYRLNVTNVAEEYTATDVARFRLFIFDYSSPVVKLVKIPIETPSTILETVHYSVRDAMTNEVIVPFDRTYNSTKLSSDSAGMYFDVWMSSLFAGRAYVIDALIVEGQEETIYRDAGPPFRVLTSGA